MDNTNQQQDEVHVLKTALMNRHFQIKQLVNSGKVVIAHDGAPGRPPDDLEPGTVRYSPSDMPWVIRLDMSRRVSADAPNPDENLEIRKEI